MPPLSNDPEDDLNALLIKLGRDGLGDLLAERTCQATRLPEPKAEPGPDLDTLLASLGEGDARVL